MSMQIFFIPGYVITGEMKHDIDQLVDDLKRAMKLEVSRDENSTNIIHILDSVINITKTSIGGKKLLYE